jgi:hypothetical protein
MAVESNFSCSLSVFLFVELTSKYFFLHLPLVRLLFAAAAAGRTKEEGEKNKFQSTSEDGKKVFFLKNSRI